MHGLTIPKGPPLYYAAQFGHIDAIKVLLEAGADPNIEDEDGKTPLHVTIIHTYILYLASPCHFQF